MMKKFTQLFDNMKKSDRKEFVMFFIKLFIFQTLFYTIMYFTFTMDKTDNTHWDYLV